MMNFTIQTRHVQPYLYKYCKRILNRRTVERIKFIRIPNVFFCFHVFNKRNVTFFVGERRDARKQFSKTMAHFFLSQSKRIKINEFKSTTAITPGNIITWIFGGC